MIKERLEIGEQTSIGFNTTIMDSDDHYMIDVNDYTVKKNTKPIRIGRFNWLGNSTHVKKGTITPDYLTVASPNALLCKDYTTLPPFSIIGGSPAKNT